tara:strand:- start:119 stop:1243 length:1125 start_codon:yes stop_codon:yes gene_type:complete
MAYQNVGTPRFFIDNYMYLRALGLDTESYIEQTGIDNDATFPNNYMISPLNNENIFTLTPDIGKPLQRSEDSMRFFIPCGNLSGIDYSGNMKWYGAMLNHNLGDCNVRIQNIMFHDAVNQDSDFFIADSQEIGILNAGNYVDVVTMQNGSSIWFSDLTPENQPYTGFAITGDGHGGSLETFEVGAISMGVMYTMPHSPDLNLSMDIEFDGYDESETLGGSTLTNIRQTGAPCWTNNGKYNSPFSVGEFSDDKMLGGAKRNGRRTWNLKFSLISDTNVFASNYMNTMHTETITDYNSSDITTENEFEYNIFTDDSFIAQVWNKTLGGALPFIFQPDSNNDNPDQFCIAKFDQDTLKVTQTAFRTYSFSVKIREVW